MKLKVRSLLLFLLLAIAGATVALLRQRLEETRENLEIRFALERQILEENRRNLEAKVSPDVVRETARAKNMSEDSGMEVLK